MSRRAVTVVVVHALLAAMALTAVAVWGTGADPALADRAVTVPDPDPRLPDNPDVLPIVVPSGLLVHDSAWLKKGEPPEALGDVEGPVLASGGVVDVKARVGENGGTRHGVWQMAVRDGADPRRALRGIDGLYADNGWRAADSPSDQVLVRTLPVSEKQPVTSLRAHYVRGPFLIRVEAYGRDGADVRRAFAELLARQLAEWPPR